MYYKLFILILNQIIILVDKSIIYYLRWKRTFSNAIGACNHMIFRINYQKCWLNVAIQFVFNVYKTTLIIRRKYNAKSIKKLSTQRIKQLKVFLIITP